MKGHSPHPGVSIRPRSGGYQLRWRERTAGESKEFTHTESDYHVALKTAKSISNKLRVARPAESIAIEDTRPSGDIKRLIPKYIASKKNPLKPQSHYLRVLRTDLTRLSGWQNWETTTDITKRSMQDVIERYQGENRRVAGFKTLGTVKNFLRWARDNEFAIHEDVLGISAKQMQPRKRVLWTQDEVARVYEYLSHPPDPDDPSLDQAKRNSPEHIERIRRRRNDRIYRSLAGLFRLETLWGPRPIEVSKLQVHMWDHTASMIRLPPDITKNGYERDIPIDPKTAGILDDLCRNAKPDELIFKTARGKQWTTNALWKTMRRVLKALGIRGTHYCTRHFAATNMVSDGRIPNFRSIMAVLGHRTMSEFQKYLHADLDMVHHVAKNGYANFIDGGAALPPAGSISMQIPRAFSIPPDEHVVYIAQNHDGACAPVSSNSLHEADQPLSQ